MNETTTRATILVETKSNNKYLFDRSLKKTVLCHPVLYFLAKLKEQGKDPQEWKDRHNDESIQIEDYGTFSREEVLYYYKKLKILEDNGYFKEIPQEKSIKAKVTTGDIKRSLANLRQLTFEVTDACGLKCAYCAYGKFYHNYDNRENTFMDIEAAKGLVDYLKELLDSPLNLSHGRNTYIGFYGGEPLLNFPFIREMVDYIENLDCQHNRFTFSITTNALLLEKYMDFLVEHDFSLLISLDGNQFNNAYRVFPNGEPTYHRILENIEALRNKYPAYFNRRVNFNAVLHNKNSVAEIFDFFKTRFNKNPRIGALNDSGVREDQAEEFWKTYANVTESLYNSEDYSRIEKEMFIKLPTIQEASTFLFQANDFCFSDYNALFYSHKTRQRFPTGTCFPFSKKMFVTVKGKIMACERIGQSYGLGHMDSKGISLDFQKIADNYNRWFDRMRKQCSACYHIDQCTQCIFYLDLSGEKPVCRSLMNAADYSRYISSFLGYFEHNRSLYNKILKEVVIE